MSRTAAVALATLGLLLALVTATLHGPRVFTPVPVTPVPHVSSTSAPPTPTPAASPTVLLPRPDGSSTPLPLAAVLVAVAGTAALLLFLLVEILRRLGQRSPRPREVRPDLPPASAPPVLDEVEASGHQAALRTGTPRDGIVACWVELERTLARRGTAPRPVETPTEVVSRLLAEHDAPSDAVETLRAAYSEARFSRHELDESDRARARDALARIHAALLPGAPR